MKHTSSISRLRKGGETMRLVLVFVLVGILTASIACAVTYSEVLYPHPNGTTGVNWIALRGVPFNPDPIDIFGSVDLIDGFLSRLDPITANTETYFSFQEPEGPFGNMLLGEGYWVNVGDGIQHTINYEGAPDGLKDSNGVMTDMWISLPGRSGHNGGFHWVGFPFNHNVLWSDVLVTDGKETIPVMVAVDRGWLDGLWAYVDAPTQNTLNVDPDGIYGSDMLEPGRMYRVFTRKSNLALIIPAGEVEE